MFFVKIAANLNNTNSIKSFLTSTTDSSMISAISTAQLNSLGMNTPVALATIPAQNLPKAFVNRINKLKLFFSYIYTD